MKIFLTIKYNKYSTKEYRIKSTANYSEISYEEKVFNNFEDAKYFILTKIERNSGFKFLNITNENWVECKNGFILDIFTHFFGFC